MWLSGEEQEIQLERSRRGLFNFSFMSLAWAWVEVSSVTSLLTPRPPVEWRVNTRLCQDANPLPGPGGSGTHGLTGQSVVLVWVCQLCRHHGKKT